MAYSYEVRKLALADHANGMTYPMIQAKYGITSSIISGWKKRFNETGYFGRLAYSPGAPAAISTKEFLEYMSDPVNQGKTQAEIGAHWGQSPMTICNMMKKIGFTRKKKTLPTQKATL
jgi:transposase